MSGKKFDQGKLRYDLVPVESHEALAEVFTYGSTKYGDNNWQDVDSNRYEAALFRHLNEWRKGNKFDNESNLSHLSHALANVAILLYKDGKIKNDTNDKNKLTNDNLDDIFKEELDREMEKMEYYFKEQSI